MHTCGRTRLLGSGRMRSVEAVPWPCLDQGTCCISRVYRVATRSCVYRSTPASISQKQVTADVGSVSSILPIHTPPSASRAGGRFEDALLASFEDAYSLHGPITYGWPRATKLQRLGMTACHYLPGPAGPLSSSIRSASPVHGSRDSDMQDSSGCRSLAFPSRTRPPIRPQCRGAPWRPVGAPPRPLPPPPGSESFRRG